VKNDCVGIVDWGIGGLSVYKELKRQIKTGNYIYFSDSGFTPYGKAKKTDLIKRLSQVLQFFREKNVSTIIIACNAASTVLESVQKKNPDLQLYGMLSAGKEAILKEKKKSALVLGGKRTIASQYFQKSFLPVKTMKLQALVAQPLSALIEKGQHKESVFEKEVLSLKHKTKFEPDIVLLACTHYPAAEGVFQKVFPKSKIIDPAHILVKNLKSKLKNTKNQKQAQFYTTGSTTESKSAAKKAFDLKIKKFHKLRLNEKSVL